MKKEHPHKSTILYQTYLFRQLTLYYCLYANTLILTGCGEKKRHIDDLVTIDLGTTYPKLDIHLQDFMDIEYIPLDNSDEFLCQGKVRAIDNNIIVVTNRNDDGDIFIFDHTGKGIKKINRKGQGTGEYTQILNILLDKEHDELLVVMHKRFLVYDMNGIFKRSLKYMDNAYYYDMYNYDRDNWICYITYHLDDNITEEHHAFSIISKHDGSINREIPIWTKSIRTPVMSINYVNISDTQISEPVTVVPNVRTIVPDHAGWILQNMSSDTIFRYSPEKTLVPILTRTPSIHDMQPEVFLFPRNITDRYIFIETIKKEWNISKMSGFPTTALAYDRKENGIYEYEIYNDDYDNSKISMATQPVNEEIATYHVYEAHKLVEACANGQLKGKLQEIAYTLNEEDNPIIMLIKHKK
ncbi:MAG: 6-bladed beta-propeller [Tannerellaceae bacterium]|jgi:hypothetical protein|nr:6-bladed beta-propeller [Tannerellaceae bacterium]